MPDTVSGVIEVVNGRNAFVRDPGRSFQPDRADPFVASDVINRYALVTGATVTGPLRNDKQGSKLATVESVCGLTPDAFRSRTPFADLPAINPDRRFRLGVGGNTSMRIVDLFAPIGRGTRGLIVSPPKAGKTRLLEELTTAIHADSPDSRIVVLLIDERPEEVTHFRR